MRRNQSVSCAAPGEPERGFCFSPGSQVQQSCSVRLSWTSGLPWQHPGVLQLPAEEQFGMERQTPNPWVWDGEARSGSELLLADAPWPRAGPFSREFLGLDWPGGGLIKKSAASLEHLFPKDELRNDGAVIAELCLWRRLGWFRKAPGII